ncbi:MAG: GumC family protein [Vicinamibacterales bacterium]
MSHTHHEQHLTDYLRVFYKRRWTALTALLVVFLTGAINSLRTTPVYEASAPLLIEQQARKVTSLDTALEQRDYQEFDFLPTELRILQSRALAKRAVRAIGIQPATPVPSVERTGIAAVYHDARASVSRFIKSVVGAPPRIEPPPANETTAESTAIGGFLGGLSVVPVRNTRVVNLAYRSSDPEFAARAVNVLAAEYIKQSIELRLAASQEANDWLGKQLEDQRKKVEETESALQRYRETHSSITTEDKRDIVVQRLADLNAAVTKAKTDRIDREAEYNRLTMLKQDQQALDAFPAILANPYVQQLKTEIATLQKQQALLAARYGERHPEMVNATTQLRTAEAKLQTEIDQIVESVRGDFVTAQAREKSLSDALDAQKGEALASNRRGIEYGVLEREAVSNRQLYENLLQRTKESTVSGGFKSTNIQMIDRAEVPRSPILPQTSRDLFSAFLIGCVVAVALVFGLERLDNRIKLPDEIKMHLKVPFLGMVPSIRDKSAAQLLSLGTPPAFSEAIRAIRTSVIFSSPDEKSRSVLVTSTSPHEGKTIVASNLAVALAQAGQRTLVIDADMRRPRMHDVFEYAQEPGLSNVLVSDGDLGTAIRQTTIPHLSFMPAGHIPPNPAELLGSKRCDALLKGLAERFDWVIIDAPPVMAVTDAAVLAHQAGGVLFVIGSEMTARTAAATAISQLVTARGRVIGAVLNGVDLQRHSYYYAPYHRKEYAAYHTSAQQS